MKYTDFDQIRDKDKTYIELDETSFNDLVENIREELKKEFDSKLDSELQWQKEYLGANFN